MFRGGPEEERNMAFLDRLVSDLIKSSTNFNARAFVRAIGENNPAQLGSATIAGVLAAGKMGTSSPQAPSVPAPLSPIPPVPGTMVPPPPPIPRAVAAELEIPRALLFGIVRTMVAGSSTDGEMRAEEKKLIENRLGESGLAPDRIKQIHKNMVLSPSRTRTKRRCYFDLAPS
jgi:hypothetical protein